TASLADCGGTATLESIVSSEPDDAPGGGDGATKDDIQDAVIGTPDMQFDLRAERSSPGSGRTYTITYAVASGSGQPVETAASVPVPVNMGAGPDPLDITVEQDPAGTVVSWPGVPGAIAYSVVRGSLDPSISSIMSSSVICLQSGPATSTLGSEDA